ncbi:MAG: hypothetical protein ACXVNM_12455, partial [Bacteroidia bacterium]
MALKNRINQKSIHKFTKQIQQRQTVYKNQDLIFNINSEKEFLEAALDVFHFQQQNNSIYQTWNRLLKIKPENVKSIEQIPFLPVSFFKHHKITSVPESESMTVFTSSSTTSQTPSKHYVANVHLYEKSFLNGFELFYGKIKDYCILALLPGYLERQGSSLVYMCNRLISDSQHRLSGFFLNDINGLIQNINQLKKQKQKTILIG